MYKKTITYNDFNGNERTETFYFNLTKAELLQMELAQEGGMSNLIEKITNAEDVPRLVELFNTIIDKSYGQKSEDGKRFIKSEEVLEAFKQTQAYSDFYTELVTNTDLAVEFVNNIVPKDLINSSNVVSIESRN